MSRFELALTTVTPALIGSGDREGVEWTAKSVRGQLRWWYRALLGGLLVGDESAVRELEAEVFGSTGQRSALRIIARPLIEPTKRAGEDADGHPLNHQDLTKAWGVDATARVAVERRLKLEKGSTNPIGYLGYGPISYVPGKGVIYRRDRIPVRSALGLILQFRGLSAIRVDELSRALWCWLNLGGIGARSRRGFGSLHCKSADQFVNVVEKLETFRSESKSLLETFGSATSEARWTHFTNRTRIFVSERFKTWEAAMSTAGAWMIAFRRRYGSDFDERTSLQGRDYVWLKRTGPPVAQPPPIPDRAGFGLPLPFGKGEYVAGWKDQPPREKQEPGRRSSPLLIHIAHFGDDYHIVLTHLPAQLIPDNARIHFRGAHSAVTPEQKEVVFEFLKDLEAKKKITSVMK